MATYIMSGKYSSDAIKGISAKRTDKVVSLIRELGGEVRAMYALLGKSDVLLIVDLPGLEQVFKASLMLYKLTGISFTSSPAMAVDEFDQLTKSI